MAGNTKSRADLGIGLGSSNVMDGEDRKLNYYSNPDSTDLFQYFLNNIFSRFLIIYTS